MKRTSDEYGMMIMNVFTYAGLDKEQVKGIIISSVVPSLNYTLEHMCRTFFGQAPLVVGQGTKTGINILYENPREVGSDRIVTALGAFEKYGGPTIVVDFGTATTFGVVNEKKQFLGGAIMPGILVSVEALVTHASRLPKIELEIPERTIGRSTVANMQSGIINGFVGAVDHIIGKMIAELNSPNVKVVATGGQARLVSHESKYIQDIDSYLTLDGLRLAFEYSTRENSI
jgi:type III pantothenate kinase